MVYFCTTNTRSTDVDCIRFTHAMLWRLVNFEAIIRWTLIANILHMRVGAADIQLVLWRMVLHAFGKLGSDRERCTLRQYELKLLGSGQVLFHE